MFAGKGNAGLQQKI